MQLTEIITRLQWERQQIDKALAALETLRDNGRLLPILDTGRRGRKFMPAEERQRVSERMRAWATQKRA